MSIVVVEVGKKKVEVRKMKINIKSILIIFLVALLGSGLGTYGVMSYYTQKNGNPVKADNVVINEVEYTSVEKSDYTKAIEKAYDTVVEISCTIQTTSQGFFFGGTQTATSKGSGVIFSQDGYIVTNAHVIEGLTDESTLKVKIFTGDTYQARVIGSDSKTDLAVIKIDVDDLPYSSFADSSTLMLGQDVIVIGNPLGLGITCSNGIISALEKEIYINDVYMTVIQTNAAINSGNSGGGLFDIEGNLIGIVNAKKSNSSYSSTTIEGMGYAIPADTVVRIIEDLIEHGYVMDRASLGVKVLRNSSYYVSNGVIISEILEGGGAESAGLQQYDVIIGIDDDKVTSYADLGKILDKKAIGDVVTVKILRDDVEMKFDVELKAASQW